jgi:chromosome segregation ATPase
MSETEVDIDTSHAGQARTKQRAPRTGGRSAKLIEDRTADISDLELQLDRISLNQALTDTEAATARVIDLTERLVDARQQITELRGELERMRIEHHQYRAEEEAMRGSGAFRLATLIWNVRNALRL